MCLPTLLAPSSRPSNHVGAKPSLSVLHCQRAVHPGSRPLPPNTVDLAPPPSPCHSPHGISPPPRMGFHGSMGAIGTFGGRFPTLCLGGHFWRGKAHLAEKANLVQTFPKLATSPFRMCPFWEGKVALYHALHASCLAFAVQCPALVPRTRGE
jgi:hypothetical protein